MDHPSKREHKDEDENRTANCDKDLERSPESTDFRKHIQSAVEISHEAFDRETIIEYYLQGIVSAVDILDFSAIDILVDGTKVKSLGDFILEGNGKTKELSDSLTIFGDHVCHLGPQLDFFEALLPDDVGLGVIESVKVILAQVRLKLIRGIVNEALLVDIGIVILVHGITIDPGENQIFVDLKFKLSQILAFNDFNTAQVRIMSNLLVTKSILDDGISVFEFSGCFLLDDVAPHIKNLLLGTFKENQVFNRFFSAVEKRLCRDYLPIDILHL